MRSSGASSASEWAASVAGNNAESNGTSSLSGVLIFWVLRDVQDGHAELADQELG